MLPDLATEEPMSSDPWHYLCLLCSFAQPVSCRIQSGIHCLYLSMNPVLYTNLFLSYSFIPQIGKSTHCVPGPTAGSEIQRLGAESQHWPHAADSLVKMLINDYIRHHFIWSWYVL